MQHLTDKQLRNLTTEQLDEIRREVTYGVSYLEAELRMNGFKGDYDRKRSLEKYLKQVKAVLQHKRNTGQK